MKPRTVLENVKREREFNAQKATLLEDLKTAREHFSDLDVSIVSFCNEHLSSDPLGLSARLPEFDSLKVMASRVESDMKRISKKIDSHKSSYREMVQMFRREN